MSFIQLLKSIVTLLMAMAVIPPHLNPPQPNERNGLFNEFVISGGESMSISQIWENVNKVLMLNVTEAVLGRIQGVVSRLVPPSNNGPVDVLKDLLCVLQNGHGTDEAGRSAPASGYRVSGKINGWDFWVHHATPPTLCDSSQAVLDDFGFGK
ncbi:hypothetical protein TWF696_005854 [Orbilia brochopaga]|uniref:Uncharacterized protein n=1 Tax=Orbilia brochopaga TaxID=3140254 RepID=A0AAV9UVB0_9PEZI